MQRLLTILALLLAAQISAAETLTNDDVLALHRAGLSAEVIVQKISVTAAAFDTGATALIALKTAGVPDAVITAMLQAKPSTPNAPHSRPAASEPLPGPHFATSHSTLIWSGSCQVYFEYGNKQIVIRGETCRGQFTHDWKEITSVCFTFWREHPGKPRNGRDRLFPHYQAEVDLRFRDGTIVTYGSSNAPAIADIKNDFEAGYPELLQCDKTYD